MSGYAWYDAVGNFGVVLIVGSYLALQLGKLDGRGLTYALLNGAGALCVMVSLLYDFNLSSMIIECFWLAISAIGVVRWWLEQRTAGS